MNVRIHFKDFSVKDFQNVTEVKSMYSGERIELLDEKWEVIDSYECYHVTGIEIRP